MLSRFPLERVTLHGHEVAYRTAGSGPVLLLVHGMAGSSTTWRHVMQPLSQRFSVIAPDLPGHGASEKPRGDYSLGALASSVRDLLAALGHERATIVGHSLGGGVAMQFAYQFPERCDRLVLVSSGGLGEEVSVLLRALSLPGAELVLPIACAHWFYNAGEGALGLLRRVGLRPSAHLAQVWESYGSLGDAQTRTAFLHTLRAVVDRGGQRASALDRLYLAAAMPTLIVWGSHDNIIPVHQGRAAHEAIPRSQLEIFDGAGHFPHCEDPERFAEVLVQFMHATQPAQLSANEVQSLAGLVATKS